jgi:cytochrome c oxidase subunit 2
MKELLFVAIIVMVFIVIFQIAKASEYVSVLKGEEKTRKQNKTKRHGNRTVRRS